MTEEKTTHTIGTVRRASELLGIDPETVKASLDPKRFAKMLEGARNALDVRSMIWLAPDKGSREAAAKRMGTLLRAQIDDAATANMAKAALYVAIRGSKLEGTAFLKWCSLASTTDEVLELCAWPVRETWQRMAAQGLLAELVRKALEKDNYFAVWDLYDKIYSWIPASGLCDQLADRLEEIQRRELSEAREIEGSMVAYNLAQRPLPHNRWPIDRHTMEVAVELVDDINALKWLLKDRATEYPDLCHRILMKILDLLKK